MMVGEQPGDQEDKLENRLSVRQVACLPKHSRTPE